MITKQSLKAAIESAVARAEKLDIEEWRREPDAPIRYAALARDILAVEELRQAEIQHAAALLLIGLSCCIVDFNSRCYPGGPTGGKTKFEVFGLRPVGPTECRRAGDTRRKAFEQLADDEMDDSELKRMYRSLSARDLHGPRRRGHEAR